MFSDCSNSPKKTLLEKKKCQRADNSSCKSWDMFQDIWRVSDDCDVCGLHQCGDEVRGRSSADSDESEMARLREHNDVLKSHIAFLSKQLMDAKLRAHENLV